MKLDSESLDVTYNIEYSRDQDFDQTKMGVITLRFSELLDTDGFQASEIETIASQLVKQTLVRERDEERTVSILHSDGLELKKWLLINTPILKQ